MRRRSCTLVGVSRTARNAAEARDGTRRTGRGLVVLGLLLLAVAAVGVGYPLYWQHRSAEGGSRLLHETLPTVADRGTGTAGSTQCRASLPTPSAVGGHLAGILEVPGLGLRAPVLQGLSDAVLDVAVGHDPASPWPGQNGESVVLAHDVSYFAQIDTLKTGDQVTWRDACEQLTFAVTGTQITTPGAIIDTPANGRGLALVTCYPTNALFWTSERYVVETTFVRSRSVSHPATLPSEISHLIVPAPRALVAEGLTLQDNPILLGTLSITGAPSPQWKQGPAPLDVDADALESFFGAEKAIGQHELTWWRALALPGLPLPSAWTDATPLYVSVDVSGDRVLGVDLHSADVTMHLVVRGDRLLISSVVTA